MNIKRTDDTVRDNIRYHYVVTCVTCYENGSTSILCRYRRV